MTQRTWLVIATLALGACSSGTTASSSTAVPAGPAASAEVAVQSFMQAVADSNLERMSSLWGSTKGPASRTKEPPDYERRIVIIQAYLRGAPYRILSNLQDGSNPGRRILQVEIQRDKCTKQVPFTVVRADGGWLVNSIDLALLGSPGANCDPDKPDPGTSDR